ncbi:hypothetical protein [Bombiscardovia apis]|nr:hypothetical protein [Bombiscardovia apis]
MSKSTQILGQSQEIIGRSQSLDWAGAAAEQYQNRLARSQALAEQMRLAQSATEQIAFQVQL